MIGDAFTEAAEFFAQTVAQVRDGQWDDVGLGVWSVRDLVGHTSRAMLTVEMYAGNGATHADIPSAAAYYKAALSGADIHEQVAERGVAAGDDLGEDPAAAIREIADRVLALVATLPDDQICGTPFGNIRLADYFATRVLELVVHTLDLQAATGTATNPPREALAVTLHLLADLAVDSGHASALALAATGRGPLPGGFSVLG